MWSRRRGGVVVESSSRRVFRRQYQEGYGWEAVLRGRIDVAWGTNRQGCHRPPGPLKASAIFWTDAFIGDKEPGAQRPRGKQNKNKTTDTPIHELHASTPPQEGIGVCQTSGNRNAESRALGRQLGFPHAARMPF